MILYSEMRFTILPLSSDQSHRGFLQASATPLILQTALQYSLMADRRRHLPAPKHRPITNSKLRESLKIYYTEVDTKSHGGVICAFEPKAADKSLYSKCFFLLKS